MSDADVKHKLVNADEEEQVLAQFGFDPKTLKPGCMAILFSIDGPTALFATAEGVAEDRLDEMETMAAMGACMLERADDHAWVEDLLEWGQEHLSMTVESIDAEDEDADEDDGDVMPPPANRVLH
jgi:hypothetical protein